MSFKLPDNYNLAIGSHVSMKGDDYFYGSVQEALSYDANALMIYTGAPQNTKRIPIEELHVPEAKALLAEHHIPLENVIVHAPYIINLCSAQASTRQLAHDFLITEIKRTQAMGAKHLVLHPGSRLKQDLQVGLDQVVDGLNDVLDHLSTDVVICLETMAGKGSEVNVNLEEMEYIVKHIHKQANIGVCLDTCHINDEGYPIADFDSYLKDLDARIGIEKVKVIHLNDSKNALAAHKDRHENLGYGHIGFEALLKVVYHPLLNGVPKILETPYFSFEAPSDKTPNTMKEISLPLYKYEIDMLRKGQWYDIKKEILTSYLKKTFKSC